MAVIVQRIFTGGFGATDNAIQLYDEELVLPMGFGDNQHPDVLRRSRSTRFGQHCLELEFGGLHHLGYCRG